MATQLWVTDYANGYVYSDVMSDELRIVAQPMLKFRQCADIKDAAHQGLHKGSVFHWEIIGDLATQGTVLSETVEMPKTGYTITTGTLTVNEYGNSVDYSGKLDNLSYLPVKERIHKSLANDCAKALDTAAHTAFAATPLRVSPTAGTSTSAITLLTTGTATDTNSVHLNNTHVKLIADQMAERNIPAYEADDYVAIGRPTTFSTLRDNLESISQYVESGHDRIMNGEIGRYSGIRFIRQTGVAKGTGTTAGTTWGTGDAVFFLGKDTVAEAIAIPEEIRGSIPTDMGRSRALGWYYLGGFALERTTAADARVLMWDSAA